MARRAARRVDPEDWEGHPALQAWRAVGGRCPSEVFALKGDGRGDSKSSIHRLEHAASDGADVVAKRGLRETIAIERCVYQRILPDLPLPSLRCLGSLPDPDPRFAWLFLDAAAGAEFDADSAPHRAAAGAWLAVLHAGSEAHPALLELPDRGPDHYLEHLRGARRRMAECFENPALRGADRELLDAILRGLDVVESHWGAVDEACAHAPRVLVHADFAARNVRIEGADPAARVWVFDWEVAGRGVPGIDLVRADAEVYAAAVRGRWPHLDLPQQLQLGRLLRGCLAPIGWETHALDTPWVERPLRNLGSYRRRLEGFLSDAGWVGGGRGPRPGEPPGACGDPHRHPAARAWRRLGRSDAGLVAVEPLRRKQVSQVYRLVGVGPAGRVVAKRTSRAVGAIERCVYQQALPRLPLRGLGCEGVLEDADACWLFLEDAGSERAEGPEARRLLSVWLAGLHTSAAEIAETLPLPERGADHHRERLRDALRPLREPLANPALSAADRWVLRELGDALARLDARWDEVAALCARMPRTLVHGDLGPSNLHLHRADGKSELLVLDWETAGIGPPAVDLVAADPDLYATLVASRWPGVTAGAVARWQRCGRLLRLVVATAWEGSELATPWIERPMARLRVYRDELRRAIAALDLAPGARP